ncbi:hypothetical protein GCM10020255_003610 [Rhodococcus baikonurensis]
MQLTDDIVAETPVIENGRMHVSGKPGIGIEIDEDKLNHYRIDKD